MATKRTDELAVILKDLEDGVETWEAETEHALHDAIDVLTKVYGKVVRDAAVVRERVDHLEALLGAAATQGA